MIILEKILLGLLFLSLASCLKLSNEQTASPKPMNDLACSSPKSSTANAAAVNAPILSLDKCQTERPVSTYPRGKQEWNEKLYKLLKSINAKESLKKINGINVNTIEIFDLLCVLTPPAEGKNETTTRCEYWLTPKSDDTKDKVIVKGPNAETLRIFLYDFPVKQGDSGASTPFIRCEKSDKVEVECHIAISLNYEGP